MGISKGKGPGSSKTVFSSTRETLKALKTREDNAVAQARWSQVKYDWKEKIIAEMEERERNQAQSAAPEADRFGADERQLALQAIREEQAKEEEEECKHVEAVERIDAAPIDLDGASKDRIDA